VTAPTRFSQADLTRALKGAEKAGLRVGRARITPAGEIELTFHEAANDTGRNPLDRVFRQ
jgi:hypothetical protein